jgi:hypothetical protein
MNSGEHAMPMVRRKGFRRGFDLERLEAPGVVFTYAIADKTALKIGKSAGHPITRLRELQVANPRRLQLVGWSVTVTEAQAHRALRKAHIRGEWYALDALSLGYIARFDWLDVKLWSALWRASRTVASA